MQSDELKRLLDDFKKNFLDKKEYIATHADKLREVCGELDAAWSGSFLDTHWDLYYGNFEKPPLERHFNIEWGLVNGLPLGWKAQDGEIVKEELQRRFSESVSLEKFEHEVEETVRLGNDLKRECETIQASLDADSDKYELSLCERIINAKIGIDVNKHVGELVLGSATTRDSRAIYSRRRGVPGQTYYDAVGLSAKTLVRNGSDFIKDTEILIRRLEESKNASTSEETIKKIIDRFDIVARQLQNRHNNRNALIITDEYDVQDLLQALLRIFFEDVRPEEAVPSTGGKSGRIDFLIIEESSAIETKFTSASNKNRIRDELLVDIATYKKHPKVKTLICFVYDPNGLVQNPRGFESDIEEQSDNQLTVRCFIRP